MCSWYQTHASGLIGSPTDPSSRSVDRSCCLRVLRPPLHVRADRRRRRVEDRHPVALRDLPPAVAVREVRRALVHHAGRAVAERAVDDVAVAGDPADVGRAPEDVGLRLQIEDVVVRRRDADQIAARRVRDPLRLRGRARTCTSGTADPRCPSAPAGTTPGSPRPARRPRAASGRAPPVIGTSSPVRRTTRLRRIRGASAIASSAICFSGTVVPRRHASSCVISTSQPMSFIRADNESAEKPPKTTVCGAPSRVQASIATASSGTIPM